MYLHTCICTCAVINVTGLAVQFAIFCILILCMTILTAAQNLCGVATFMHAVL